MADKQFKYIEFATEIMTASAHVHLSKPDTKGEYANGKYKTEATADVSYTVIFQAAIRVVAYEQFRGKINIHPPWRETKNGTAFSFNSPKMAPELTDAKGNPLAPNIIICIGTLIRIAGVMAAWEKGSMRGVSLWPNAVRVIRLPDIFNASAAFGPPEDGFDGSLK